MSTIVTRLFRDPEHATQAAAELKRNGFDDEDITVTGPGTPADEIAASIARAGISKRTAETYAASVRDGSVAVSVRAVFGWAAIANCTDQSSEARMLSALAA